MKNNLKESHTYPGEQIFKTRTAEARGFVHTLSVLWYPNASIALVKSLVVIVKLKDLFWVAPSET